MSQAKAYALTLWGLFIIVPESRAFVDLLKDKILNLWLIRK
ncbi:MAG: hypothetical protein NZ551_01530 [Microscillaceae bacterium]|nr:hypothetical protein [Microscillaceae bacterium]MDW8459869.1 hypothetical protein [Cytophagales bacterium]